MPLRVVNVVPATMSNETNGDTEPSIAVDTRNPQRIAIAAFTPDPASSGSAPIYVSTDGGVNWTTIVCLPGGNTTNDSSIRFAGHEGTFYAAILRGDTANLEILRSAFPPAGLMTQLINRSGPDQPWDVASWAGVSGGTAERVYVTSNDGGQAAVQFSQNAATAPAPAGFGAPINLQLRPGSSRPSVRGAIHRSGRIYITFIRVTVGGSDVVVMRDDAWGNNAFADLVDTGDTIAGVRVVSGVTVPPVGTLLGTQRVSSRIAIAVDPRNRRRVYLAWCDGAVTVMSPFTLHLRRSDDGGATWTADLRIIQNVTNPCLAVNVQGVVALMYQQLVTAVGGNRWNTILERSTDMFASVATTSTLANTPPGVGFGAAGDLGDFCNLISAGKDFYGTFSAVNAPLNANFPSGVTFLRNADFATGNLRNVANTANVATSVDPFFVHWQTVEPKDDVFVRDWTDSAAVADDGVEPSLRSAFYVTPDVWNRRGTDAGAFVSDRPSNEDAGNGTGDIGKNWLFARIRRRAAASPGGPDLAVTAHFLVSPLGTGSNYVDASSMDPNVSFPDPDPVVTFTAAEVGPKLTDPFPWHLNPVSSTHLCAAVEISAPGDPFVGASLRGRAPGWPDTDLEIVDDNNKAQRNMGLSTTPSRESAGESVVWAIVHNAATSRRDLELVVRPAKLRDVQPRLSITILSVGLEPMQIRDEGRIVLRKMEPLENRWVGIRMRGVSGKRGLVAAAEFGEMLGDAAINGFGLGIQLGSDREVAAHAHERLRSIATRLVYGWKVDANDLLQSLSKSKMLKFPETAVMVRELVDAAMHQGEDQFGVGPAFETFARAARKEGNGRLVALTSLMESMDAHLTALQLSRGNRADILQTVQWELAVLKAAEHVENRALEQIGARCQQFVSEWEIRKVNVADAVTLVRGTVEPLATLGSEAKQRELAKLAGAALEAADDLDLFQGRYAALVRALAQVLAPRKRS